jgi:thioredoxin 1
VVIYFYTTWAQPHKKMGPLIEELSMKLDQENIVFGKVDCDMNKEAAEQSEVQAFPTIIIWKQGIQVE